MKNASNRNYLSGFRLETLDKSKNRMHYENLGDWLVDESINCKFTLTHVL